MSRLEMSVCTRLIGPQSSCDDPVARAFMGDRNVDRINAAIIQGVYNASEGRFRIGRQSQQALSAIMRSVYLSEARHLPGLVEAQVNRLNESVLSYAVPQIVSEASMHDYYLRDLQTGRSIPPPSVMTSTAGSKSEVAAASRPYFLPQS